ncbi:MAG: glycosyltransferase [Ilumatobacteraceae bacterium]|nr:glycosyltransferase [Ilumatobacteraceae bacterium]
MSAISLTVRATAGAFAISRLAGAARAARPIERDTERTDARSTISVVIPARDEAERIGPLLETIVGAPGVTEVLVVDDESTDATAGTATAAGAHVVTGRPLPEGWAGKAWALQQGVEAAEGEWVVTLDADTRPDPALPTAVVARAIADGFDLLTIGGRFDCPTPGARWLHPAMLTTLVYRYGPPGIDVTARRTMANGQCMVLRRSLFLAAGGLASVCGEVVEDIALARHLASSGWRVGFLDGADLLTVRMFESFADTWRGWGRSIALPGVERPTQQLAGLAVVALAQALPLWRLLAGRADGVDGLLLALRVGTLVGTRSAYLERGVGYWLSPLADGLAAASLGLSIVRRGPHRWRGRIYA